MTDRPRTPDEIPPNTTPVDPEVLATADEGLEPRPGARQRVVIVGAGPAGLVAAWPRRSTRGPRSGRDPGAGL
jgi:NADPH-dependent 2,4-dienoyl-CoA reductase/sulfur reductase-like enzyme